MKMRNGFVSNSSSSSFIMGLGVVADLVKFEQWMKGKTANYTIMPLSELEKQTGWFDGPSIHGTQLEIENCGYVASIDIKNINTDGPTHEVAKNFLIYGMDPLIFWFDGYGPEPFYNDNYNSYDYDSIDLNWFTNDEATIYKGLVSRTIPGVTLSDATFGGGYDG